MTLFCQVGEKNYFPAATLEGKKISIKDSYTICNMYIMIIMI